MAGQPFGFVGGGRRRVTDIEVAAVTAGVCHTTEQKPK
jgi:hypothetical protein